MAPPFRTVALLAAWAPTLVEASADQATLLRHTSLLMAHDAATGFVGELDIRRPFVQTQTVDLVQQLSCGARAMDIRIVLEHDGSLRYHHGRGIPSWVSDDQTLDNTLPDLTKWAAEHPSELVLFMLSHCFTRASLELKWEELDCTDSRILAGFTKSGLRVQTNCSTVNAWTAAEARQHAAMANGGKMIVVPGEGQCLDANFEPKNTKREMIEPYVERTVQAGRKEEHLWSVQAIVQQKFEVPLGDSAVLNPQAVDWAKGGKILQGVNFFEVNLICASGQALAAAFGTKVTEADRTACAKACHDTCIKYKCSPTRTLATEETALLV
mmetsp:Transcript_102503/g.330742  ORF Transcript_102503/g.330742 Transcript_102503/m.330742 type:complete len:326 (-) Transcript_102503:63-1040(-)